MKARLPDDELKRLEKLRSYGVLDSDPETGFDDVTILASSIFGVPISAVSLVDDQRQWFKSKQGLDATETPRDWAFCAHAILERQVLVVNDATKDPRFNDNPLVVNAPEIRFYAGAPLVTDDGFALGSLCVIDRKPRSPDSTQLQALQALARHVVTMLELRKRNTELEQARTTIADQHKKMLETARLAAIGDLASGVAHEVNNPLAIIIGRAEQIKEVLKRPEVDRPRIADLSAKIIEGSNRIAKIVQGLKAFGGDGADAPRSISANALIGETLTFCRERAKSRGIEVQVQMQSGEAMIWCRPVAIAQALLALINNSLEAIEIGRSKRQAQTNDWIVIEVQSRGADIEFSVTDSGWGLSSEHRAKLFQPFFTTKPPGRAVGMGLNIAKGVATSHHGSLRFDANSPHTRFILSIPRSRPSRSEAA